MNRSSNRADRPLEIWGGIECTVNRVGDRYFDQMLWNGHHDRFDDLAAIAELGIKTLRYPVLWERVAPRGLGSADWTWTDERLAELRRLGIRPVVTLVHHGSGPIATHLLDDDFANGLEHFARAVAERYPWIEDYTPINEPLTTARFSALYGHWFPHHQDSRSMLKALLNETAGTVAAMRAIRSVNSAARLIQTEDIGKCHSTPVLAYQADFENERRWLSLDLLCGRVSRDHPMFPFLRHVGLDEAVRSFEEETCPPDMIGLNYYATSERYLDERLDRYPPHTHGGNGRHAYADVEALRCAEATVGGLVGILQEAAERFDRPLAITEVHLGGTREEQLRWLARSMASARLARDEGINLRALTVWALLGSHNWTSLVTRDDGHYEAGAFDASSGTLRRTALGEFAAALAHDRAFHHPALDAPGWWEREDRVVYGALVPSGWTDGRSWTGRFIEISGHPSGCSIVRRACNRRHLRAELAGSSGGERAQPWARLRCGASRAVESEGGYEVVVTTDGCAVDGTHAMAGADELRIVLRSADRDRFQRELEIVVDQVLDLVVDRSTGLWRSTEDARLIPVPHSAPAEVAMRTSGLGVSARVQAMPLDGGTGFR